MIIRIVSICLFLVLSCGLGRNVRACKLPTSSINSRTTLPVDGMKDVPTNTDILLEYKYTLFSGGGGGFSIDETFRLLDAKGKEVTLKKRIGASRTTGYWGRYVVILEPSAELSPNTTYTLSSNLSKLPCALPSGCQPGDFSKIMSFHTGAASDKTPPSFRGIEKLSGCEPASQCRSSACCGPYVQRTFALYWKSSKEAASSIRYNVYGDGVLFFERISTTSFAVTVSLSGTSFTPSSWSVLRSAPQKVTVRAVDMAGNEDTNRNSFDVPKVCSQIPVDEREGEQERDQDGGVLDATPDTRGGGDAPAREFSDVPESKHSVGCQSAYGPVGGLDFFWLLAVFLVLLYRRAWCLFKRQCC
ncbi:MAG: hypothetical protein CL920_29000 [Deltaproteobacteria bacterium]|nr:hypothetical protein [Deltaproteobacteria bacterium]